MKVKCRGFEGQLVSMYRIAYTLGGHAYYDVDIELSGSAGDLTLRAVPEYDIEFMSEVSEGAKAVLAEWINEGPYVSAGGEMRKAQICPHCDSVFVSPADTPWPNHPYCAECGVKMKV